MIAYAIPGIAPSLEMLEELVGAGLRTKYPFTLDPRPPLDYDNWALDGWQVEILDGMYRDQARYEDLLLQLGLRDADAYTCRPFLEEVGNIPKRGDVLAWSESACVVYANSVLGARTNRNGAIMDLLCNVAGKVPLSGLLETARGGPPGASTSRPPTCRCPSCSGRPSAGACWRTSQWSPASSAS